MDNRVAVNQQLNEELAGDEIHIWCVSLQQPVSRFQRLLSLDERMRAERFHFEEHRKHFILRRGILRMLLGSYLGIEPGNVQFCYGKNEKPALAGRFGKRKLHFNLSHSDGLALYAFARRREIGVDIEYIRDVPEMGQIAERYFSAGEKDIFQMLPEHKRKQAFFNCWTRKEAFIKATGDGLSWPLDRFDVSLVPGEPARLLRIDGESKTASRWLIHELKLAPGFAAALAVEGRIGRIHCREWPIPSSVN